MEDEFTSFPLANFAPAAACAAYGKMLTPLCFAHAAVSDGLKMQNVHSRRFQLSRPLAFNPGVGLNTHITFNVVARPLRIPFNHIKSASITDRLIIALVLHHADRFACALAKSAARNTLPYQRQSRSLFHRRSFHFPQHFVSVCMCLCEIYTRSPTP
jgi:hypothetical protein